MVQGNLYIISAPSGAGKSSLIRALLTTEPNYDTRVSISHTTREMRSGEKHAEHYYFISKQEFEDKINAGDFLEYAQVFGNYYGTSRKTIEKELSQGIDVFLDIDWQGAQQIRKQIPEVRSIFILPPSKEELERRLKGRGQDSDIIIQQRMNEAIAEMSHYDEYDYLIINNDFDVALNELKTIIRAERLYLSRQKKRYATLIGKLLADH